MSSLNVVVGVAVFIYIRPHLDDTNLDVSNKLQASATKYDWFHDQDSSIDIKNATLLLDDVQTAAICCGIDQPNDWDSYRPKNLSSSLFPPSCCLTPTSIDSSESAEKFCNQIDIWQTGCNTTFKNINNDLLIVIHALIWINLILSLMGCTVLCCGPERDDYYPPVSGQRFVKSYQST